MMGRNRTWAEGFERYEGEARRTHSVPVLGGGGMRDKSGVAGQVARARWRWHDWWRAAVGTSACVLLGLGVGALCVGLVAVALANLTGSDHLGAWGVVGITYGAVTALASLALLGLLGRRRH